MAVVHHDSPHRHRPLVVLLAAVLVAVTITTAAPSAPSRAGTSAATPSGYAAQVNDATNDARSRQGLRRLTVNACLKEAARRQAQLMADQGRISHSPDFSSIGPRCGVRSWAENTAQALPGDRGRGVVRQWMRSSEHRTNILRRTYRVIGSGAVRRGGSWWVVQIFGRR